MPFFEAAKGEITMNNCSMTDVAGNMHHYDYSSTSHIGHRPRGPSYVLHTTDSHSTPSASMGGEQIELDTVGQIISGLVYTSVHGKVQLNNPGGVAQSAQRHTDRKTAKSTVKLLREEPSEGRLYNCYPPDIRLAESHRRRSEVEYLLQDNHGEATDAQPEESQSRHRYSPYKRPAMKQL